MHTLPSSQPVRCEDACHMVPSPAGGEGTLWHCPSHLQSHIRVTRSETCALSREKEPAVFVAPFGPLIH
jgi:hypothetical protein